MTVDAKHNEGVIDAAVVVVEGKMAGSGSRYTSMYVRSPHISNWFPVYDIA